MAIVWQWSEAEARLRLEVMYGKLVEQPRDERVEKLRADAIRAEVRDCERLNIFERARLQVAASLARVRKITIVQSLARRKAAKKRVAELRKRPNEEQRRKLEKPLQTLKRLKPTLGSCAGAETR